MAAADAPGAGALGTAAGGPPEQALTWAELRLAAAEGFEELLRRKQMQQWMAAGGAAAEGGRAPRGTSRSPYRAPAKPEGELWVWRRKAHRPPARQPAVARACVRPGAKRCTCTCVCASALPAGPEPMQVKLRPAGADAPMQSPNAAAAASASPKFADAPEPQPAAAPAKDAPAASAGPCSPSGALPQGTQVSPPAGSRRGQTTAAARYRASPQGVDDMDAVLALPDADADGDGDDSPPIVLRPTESAPSGGAASPPLQQQQQQQQHSVSVRPDSAPSRPAIPHAVLYPPVAPAAAATEDLSLPAPPTQQPGLSGGVGEGAVMEMAAARAGAGEGLDAAAMRRAITASMAAMQRGQQDLVRMSASPDPNTPPQLSQRSTHSALTQHQADSVTSSPIEVPGAPTHPAALATSASQPAAASHQPLNAPHHHHHHQQALTMQASGPTPGAAAAAAGPGSPRSSGGFNRTPGAVATTAALPSSPAAKRHHGAAVPEPPSPQALLAHAAAAAPAEAAAPTSSSAALDWRPAYDASVAAAVAAPPQSAQQQPGLGLAPGLARADASHQPPLPPHPQPPLSAAATANDDVAAQGTPSHGPGLAPGLGGGGGGGHEPDDFGRLLSEIRHLSVLRKALKAEFEALGQGEGMEALAASLPTGTLTGLGDQPATDPPAPEHAHSGTEPAPGDGQVHDVSTSLPSSEPPPTQGQQQQQPAAAPARAPLLQWTLPSRAPNRPNQPTAQPPPQQPPPAAPAAPPAVPEATHHHRHHDHQHAPQHSAPPPLLLSGSYGAGGPGGEASPPSPSTLTPVAAEGMLVQVRLPWPRGTAEQLKCSCSSHCRT